jgi:hypothetical protein
MESDGWGQPELANSCAIALHFVHVHTKLMRLASKAIWSYRVVKRDSPLDGFS